MSFADDLMQAANALLEKKRSNITEAMVLIANPASLPKILRAKEEAERWSRDVSYAFTDDLPRDVAHKVAKASRTNGPASKIGASPAPTVYEPPWIHTKTGSDSPAATSAGVVTDRRRQSSS